mmetsp:Transcript_58077/g.189067  ORF Transcript_58077/g.189067 Transcript_58077/m.189067 type:complete len:265 (-) Transcript_58077:1504-2298(-)
MGPLRSTCARMVRSWASRSTAASLPPRAPPCGGWVPLQVTSAVRIGPLLSGSSRLGVVMPPSRQPASPALGCPTIASGRTWIKLASSLALTVTRSQEIRPSTCAKPTPSRPPPVAPNCPRANPTHVRWASPPVLACSTAVGTSPVASSSRASRRAARAPRPVAPATVAPRRPSLASPRVYSRAPRRLVRRSSARPSPWTPSLRRLRAQARPRASPALWAAPTAGRSSATPRRTAAAPRAASQALRPRAIRTCAAPTACPAAAGT